MVVQLEKTGMDVEFVEAVDGRDLGSRASTGTGASRVAAKSLLPNETACVESHVRVYGRILEDGADTAVVLEDDVEVPANLAAIAESAASHMVGAEIALLNFDSTGECLLSGEEAVVLPPGRQLLLPIDVGVLYSSAAYVITREACERLSKGLFPVAALADNWGYRYEQGMIDRVRCMVPLGVRKSPLFASTMDYNSPDSLKFRVNAFVDRHNLAIIQRLIVIRRRRIWRRLLKVRIVDAPFVNKPCRFE